MPYLRMDRVGRATTIIQCICAVLVIAVLSMPTSASDVKCPAKCHCSKLSPSNELRVSCERNKLLQVPQGIPASTTELYLGYNLISHLQEYTFYTLTQLTVLSLKSNLLAILDDEAFAGLPNLKSLFLTLNSLTNITPRVFAPLRSLENLYLTDNKLQAIPDLPANELLRKLNLDNNQLKNASFPEGFKQLKALSSIVLNNNPAIGRIQRVDFQSLGNSPVAKLTLERCKLTKIENGTFSVFTQLKSLALSYNSIPAEDVQFLIAGLAGSGINSLDLSGVIKSGTLPANTFEPLRGVPLLHLFLRHSEIDNLLSNTFSMFDELQSLDVSYSRINKAEPDAFVGLVKLQRLLLYRNRFKVFPTNLPLSCTYIDMSHNQLDITVLNDDVVGKLDNLEEFYVHDCGLTQIAKTAFKSTTSLKKLDLSNNALPNNDISGKVFSSLFNLEELSLANNKLKNFQEERSPFIDLSNLKKLDMSGNGCEKLPTESFSGLSNLTSLDLSNNNLGDQLATDANADLFSALKALQTLDLSHNNIYSLTSDLFNSLVKMEKLYLQKNDINRWDGEIFRNTHSMTFMNLSSNHISIINQTSLSEAEKTLQSLDLSNNPFSCYCSLVWFRNWMDRTNVTLVKVPEYTCSSPKTMMGKTVLSFNPLLIESECSPPPWVIIIVSTSTGVAIGLIALFTAGYRNRWKLRLKWYLYVQQRNARQGGDEDPLVDNAIDHHKYDCYVSVCYHDEDWVRDVLIPKMDNGHALPGWENQEPLGNGRHCLCCENIHLLAGTRQGRFGQIAQAIHDSHKVMILLTTNYLRSGQQMEFELELALHKVTEGEGWRSVILVILEPGADVRIPHGRLHELLDDGQALKWTDDLDGQELFWRQLTERLDEQP